ncbi:hypothetical protein [uncultured Megamonas sp.]|nr:hypothetical protein [uncultured Megamonas sp.]
MLSSVPVPEKFFLPENITASIAGGVLCGIGIGMNYYWCKNIKV